ncbi:MAG: component of SufBCD complex [Pseudomonadota bacterium]
MDWYETVFELIDMRSFSNLWYWIALAVLWSTASHWVIGVPYDMVQRARREGQGGAEDLADIVRINVNRIDYISKVSGIWILGFGSAIMTALCILGFVYWVEFAQAVFLLFFPMSIVGLLTLWTVSKIRDGALTEEALYAALTRHRLITQLIGIVSIFVTAVFGMYQNLNVGALGG